MSSIINLGRLEPVPLREAWPHEAINFTPWLAEPENLAFLAETVGMVLELEAVEKPVDAFSADILARDVTNDRWVLIENQLEGTDHTHLGQILTYAAGLDAETIIWIARDFREPHRAAIDYLNRVSASEYNFFGVQVELLRIGDSAYAPRFNVVAKPNDWSKSIATKASATKVSGSVDTSGKQAKWQTYWEDFFSYAAQVGLHLVNRVPPREGWCRTMQLRSGDPSASAWLHRANDRLRALIWLQGQNRLALFDSLLMHRDIIDASLEEPVVWDRMDAKKSSMIYVEQRVDESDPSTDDAEQFSWLADRIGKLTGAILPHVRG